MVLVKFELISLCDIISVLLFNIIFESVSDISFKIILSDILALILKLPIVLLKYTLF